MSGRHIGLPVVGLSRIFVAISTAFALGGLTPAATIAQSSSYADPANPALKKGTMVIDSKRAALVVIDPQNDFMDPKGKAWPVVGEAVTEQKLVPHLHQLFSAAKAVGMVVAISPDVFP